MQIQANFVRLFLVITCVKFHVDIFNQTLKSNNVQKPQNY